MLTVRKVLFSFFRICFLCRRKIELIRTPTVFADNLCFRCAIEVKGIPQAARNQLMFNRLPYEFSFPVRRSPAIFVVTLNKIPPQTALRHLPSSILFRYVIKSLTAQL